MIRSGLRSLNEALLFEQCTKRYLNNYDETVCMYIHTYVCMQSIVYYVTRLYKIFVAVYIYMYIRITLTFNRAQSVGDPHLIFNRFKA